MTLSGDKFAPITSSIGFLRVPLDEAAEALFRWRMDLHGDVRRSDLEGGLVSGISRLEPLTGGVRPRELLVATSNAEWTAVFDCGVDGGDQVTTVGHLSRTIPCQGVVVTSIPHTASKDGRSGRYGALQFEMFGPVRTEFLNYVRTISLIHDGARWRFDANGTVQDFEDLDAYQRRRVRDRFTLANLIDYCAALGVAPFDQDFYPGPSVLLETPATPPREAKVLSLSEARAWLGID
jgi:hypothetical protein